MFYSITELVRSQDTWYMLFDAVSFHLRGLILIIPVVLGTRSYLKLYVS